METNHKIIHYNFFPSVRSQTKQNGETADSQVCETNFISLWIYIATVARKCFYRVRIIKLQHLTYKWLKTGKWVYIIFSDLY